MIATDPVRFQFRGMPATMRVFRNNGYAWGRLNLTGTQVEYDVESARDIYDWGDDDAARRLINIARRFPDRVTAPMGWEGC